MRCEPEWEAVGSSWRLTPEQGARLYVHPGKKMFYWYVQLYVGAAYAASGASRTDSNAKKACLAAWRGLRAAVKPKKGAKDAL